MRKAFSTFSDIELVANPRYWGSKPFNRRILVRNMDAPTQLAYIRSSRNEIALDLSEAQAESLSGNRSLRINASPGPDIVFLFANTNPQVSQVAADKHFQNAVRDALDYKEMVALMGLGAAGAWRDSKPAVRGPPGLGGASGAPRRGNAVVRCVGL